MNSERLSKSEIIFKIFAYLLVTIFAILCLYPLIYAFSAVPKEIEEAATIDGANEFQVFSRVYIPMSGASIATVTLFYAISRWNGYYWQRMLLKDSNEQALQVYLRTLIENYQKLYDESAVVLPYAADSLVYAIIICSIIPVLIVYPYIQKYFARGVNLGGVKG